MNFLHILSRETAIKMGLKFYFTGNSCKNGHFDLRRVDSSACISCLAEQRKEYFPQWYQNNSDDHKANSKKWRTDNKERVTYLVRRWIENNPEYRRQYLSQNLEKFRASNAKRRAKIKGNGGYYTPGDIETMLISQKGLCAGCRCSLEIVGYHVDHKTPISKGGSNWPENLQLLCPTCNLRKKQQGL